MASDYTTIHEYCVGLLTNPSLEDKLRPPVQASGASLVDGGEGALVIEAPARSDELQMVDHVGRLPAVQHLVDPGARRACLARFAHHELQAVELFAWALLAWPQMEEEMKRGFLGVIEDEQRHTKFYLARLEAMGAELGDEPLSDFFWRHAPAILASGHGPRAFVCAMGLTLEQANLDYALYFKDAFAQVGDAETAAVLQRVHDDEIQHVALAYAWLGRMKEPDCTLVDAYRHYVPFPFSASRARGKGFDEAGRRKAGLSAEFIAYVRAAEHYGHKFNQAVEGAILLPNLGFEDGVSWKRSRFDPWVVQVSALWRLLYSNKSQVIDTPHASAPWWPEDLGTPCAGPVFEALEDEGRLVPWIWEAALTPFCEKRKLRCDAGDAEVTARVHDRAFVLDYVRERGLAPERLAGLARAFDPSEFADARSLHAQIEQTLAEWPDWARDGARLRSRRGSSSREAPGGLSVACSWQGLVDHHPEFRRAGGFILEPGLETISCLAACFFVAPRGDDEGDDEGDVEGDAEPQGEIELLGSVCKRLTDSGAYEGHYGQVEATGRMHSGHAFEDEFVGYAIEFARCLAGEGYYGPLEVEGRTLRDPVSGDAFFEPVSSGNARHSLALVCLGLVQRASNAGLLSDLPSAYGHTWEFSIDGSGHDLEAVRSAGSVVIDLSAPQHAARTLRPTLWFQSRSSDLH